MLSLDVLCLYLWVECSSIRASQYVSVDFQSRWIGLYFWSVDDIVWYINSMHSIILSVLQTSQLLGNWPNLLARSMYKTDGPAWLPWYKNSCGSSTQFYIVYLASDRRPPIKIVKDILCFRMVLYFHERLDMWKRIDHDRSVDYIRRITKSFTIFMQYENAVETCNWDICMCFILYALFSTYVYTCWFQTNPIIWKLQALILFLFQFSYKYGIRQHIIRLQG